MAKKKSSNLPTIEFAPGCFDTFEGTQEELDQLVNEIQNMFKNKTAEEIKAMSRPLDIDELIDEEPELAQKLFESFISDDNERKLQ